MRCRDIKMNDTKPSDFLQSGTQHNWPNQLSYQNVLTNITYLIMPCWASFCSMSFCDMSFSWMSSFSMSLHQLWMSILWQTNAGRKFSQKNRQKGQVLNPMINFRSDCSNVLNFIWYESKLAGLDLPNRLLKQTFVSAMSLLFSLS